MGAEGRQSEKGGISRVLALINHISPNEQGIAYIAGTTLKVAFLVIDVQTWKLSAEQIQENYPALSLSQIYAALAYYYDHKFVMDTQIREEAEEYERPRIEFPNVFTREELEKRRQQQSRSSAE